MNLRWFSYCLLFLLLAVIPLQGNASHACDHQGNVRVVMGGDGTLEQVTHYYPFGGIYGDAGLNAEFQPYKYNGKELDRMHGLDWYDYGARQYDAAGVPMFTTIDPMAEKYYHLSPYAYCANNPIKYIDKDGEVPLRVLGRMAFKVASRGISALWETATYADMVYEMANDVSVLMDADASLTDKGWAVYDLFSPIGTKETKAGIQLLQKTHGGKIEEMLKSMRRGRESETKVLKEIGEKKNTQKYPATLEDGERINVIPDAVTDDKVIEIKDAKAVYDTKQIKGERKISNDLGKKFIIITGEKTHTPTIPEWEIRRRKDLGPQ